MSDDFRAEREVAVATAREAGELLRAMHGKVRDVRRKGVVDLVTEADRASEALIADRLQSAFPGDQLLAEEGTGRGVNAASRRLWIVDPLDGTTNYSHGHPVFCVSIALMVEGVIEVGAVFDPLRNEMFVAGRGHGASLNGEPIRVSETGALIDAMLATGFAYDPAYRLQNIPFLSRFVELTQAVRREGAAALDVCYVGCGRFDGYWERGVSAWDVAAASLILAEAGGRSSGYSGEQFDVFSRQIVASNGKLHEDMLDAIATVVAIHGLPAASFT